MGKRDGEMSELVRIESLVKHFGPIKAVDGIQLLGPPGRGARVPRAPNGAGKSTTMKIVTGFLPADSGRIAVGGEDIAANPIAAKRRIGYLPEGAPLYSDMTTRAFLEFAAGDPRVPGRRTAPAGGRDGGPGSSSRASSSSRSTPCPRASSAGWASPSRSCTTRRCSSSTSRPTGSTPNQKHEVRSLIREMAPRKAIILSTHLLEEVDAVCSRAVIISAGRIVSDGAPEDLHARADGHNAVTLALRGVAAESARAALAAVEGVREVEEVGGGGEDGDGVRLGSGRRAAAPSRSR